MCFEPSSWYILLELNFCYFFWEFWKQLLGILGSFRIIFLNSLIFTNVKFCKEFIFFEMIFIFIYLIWL